MPFSHINSCIQLALIFISQVLRSFVKNVLEKAHSNAMTSIAIPAIASGNFKTPPDIVVEILFDEIDKFSATNSPTTLKSICLVAFDQNRECVEVCLYFLYKITMESAYIIF